MMHILLFPGFPQKGQRTDISEPSFDGKTSENIFDKKAFLFEADRIDHYIRPQKILQNQI